MTIVRFHQIRIGQSQNRKFGGERLVQNRAIPSCLVLGVENVRRKRRRRSVGDREGRGEDGDEDGLGSLPSHGEGERHLDEGAVLLKDEDLNGLGRGWSGRGD